MLYKYLVNLLPALRARGAYARDELSAVEDRVCGGQKELFSPGQEVPEILCTFCARHSDAAMLRLRISPIALQTLSAICLHQENLGVPIARDPIV